VNAVGSSKNESLVITRFPMDSMQASVRSHVLVGVGLFKLLLMSKHNFQIQAQKLGRKKGLQGRELEQTTIRLAI
jgi:hypothetical protein